jgi:hypothetical protein
MANYIADQKGRLLTTVFPSYRGDAAIGGQEVIEVTVDLSVIGTGTNVASLGTQSGFPNSGVGVIATDTIDVAVLPYNFQIQSVQLIIDTNAPTPDVVPVGNLTGLTNLTVNVGDQAVLVSDRATTAAISGFTPSATAYSTGTSVFANATSLLYTAGTRYLPYTTPAASGSLTTAPAVYVLRIAVAALTGGSSTGIKAGKFRLRVGGIAYSI